MTKRLRGSHFVPALALLLLGLVSLSAADPSAAAFGAGTSGVTAPGTSPASPGPGVGRTLARLPVSPSAPPPRPQPPTFEDGIYLVIEATPAHAQVFLNDRLLGPAGQVAAWTIPVAPGSHTVTVMAAGFRPYTARVIARPIGVPTRIRVSLERQ